MNGPTDARDARGSADSHVHRYRPDVDGLRAVAVLSVIFYHIDSTLLPGGFLGVDIFFVISGFLITGIIRREQARGIFSIRNFYERRVRRIMPALLLVLLVTSVASVLLLLPLDLVGYGKSLLSTLTFVANIYFFLDTNYFAAAAELKPLLHMWSLGVEEQFYLFFPLLLILLGRWPRSVMPVIVLLSVVSLASNVALLYLGKSNPAFFLIPFRAWELGFGAILSIWLERASTGGARPAAAIAGVILLAVSLAGVDLLRSFSMPIAFLAVVGTTLLIWAHHGGLSAVGRILSSKPVVAIGLISYSLYLWHWPMLVLPRYYLVRDLTAIEATAAVIAAIAMSAVSLRYVERPFRQKKMQVRRVYSIVGALSVVSAVAAIMIVRLDGLPQRLDSRAAGISAAVGTHYRCGTTSYIPFGALYACPIALPSRDPKDADTVLFGNSHAQMYVPAVEPVLDRNGRHGLLVPANYCLPAIGVNVSPDCHRIMGRNLEAIEALPNLRTVILAYSWSVEGKILTDGDGNVLQGDESTLIFEGISRVVDELRSKDIEVVVVGPIAIPGFDIASSVSRKLAFGHEVDEPLWTDEKAFLETHAAGLKAFAKRPDITFLKPYEIQCRDGKCFFIENGESFFADGNHIASTAIGRFVPMFESAIGRGP